jgi:hypothetical protein
VGIDQTFGPLGWLVLGFLLGGLFFYGGVYVLVSWLRGTLPPR